MANILKFLAKDALYTLRRVGAGAREGGVILVYHSIADNQLFFTVSPAMFEQQMAWLKSAGFNVVSLNRLMELRANGHIPAKTVAITFDDGYKDNLTNAFPVLKKYGFPATIFVTTSDLGSTRVVREVSFDILSEGDMRELEAGGVAIEPHTMTHPKLTETPLMEVLKEIGGSKAMLERILNKTCEHFAYPKGRYNADVIQATKTAGVKFAYGTRDGFVLSAASPSPTADYEIPRNGINCETTMAQFKGIATGGRMTRDSII